MQLRTDTKKWNIIDKTIMFNQNNDVSVYCIDIIVKNICFRYIGQVKDNTIYKRYLQHASKNGLIRDMIDIIGGLDKIDSIILKCLYSYKYKNRDRLDKKELDIINSEQAKALLLKNKKRFILNTQMNKKEVFKIITQKLLTN